MSVAPEILGVRSVAKLLEQHAANAAQTGGDYEYFARSAASRYYYAMYLAARTVAFEVCGPKRLKHACLPGHLRGKVLQTFDSAAGLRRRRGVRPHPAAHGLSRRFEAAVRHLAFDLDSARVAREVADYDFGEEHRPQWSNNEIFVGDLSLADMEQRFNRVQRTAQRALSAWREIGGA